MIGKINKSKRAVSEMVSYVLLVAIAIGISVAVYAWLSDYTNTEPKIDCKGDTKIVLEEYSCENGVINMTVRNTGLFNVSGFIFLVGNNTQRAPIERLTPQGSYEKGMYYFEPELGPDSFRENIKFSMTKDIKVIQIQPFIWEDKENDKKIVCENAVIKQNIENCSYY